MTHYRRKDTKANLYKKGKSRLAKYQANESLSYIYHSKSTPLGTAGDGTCEVYRPWNGVNTAFR